MRRRELRLGLAANQTLPEFSRVVAVFGQHNLRKPEASAFGLRHFTESDMKSSRNHWQFAQYHGNASLDFAQNPG